MRSYKILTGAVALLAGVALAGCADDTSTTGGDGSGAGGATISVAELPGVGSSLVNSSGRTLYFVEAESDGNIRCVDLCTNFWIPLTVADGSTPTKDAAVTGTVTLITRPGGAHQVMYDGKPLYTFTQDSAPGEATGNGFTDSFNGITFVWHAATVSGAAAAPTSSDDAPPGYGY